MKEFNLIVTGVGGQGILTLGTVITEAALKQGYDIKQAELHGLSQRGGHVDIHIRLGEKIYSSLVLPGKANLIIGLELLETLRVCNYSSQQNKTVILTDTYAVKPPATKKYPTIGNIIKQLKQFSTRVITLDASKIAKKEVNNTMLANIYLLGFSSGADLIPIKKEFLIQAIKETVREKYLEDNLKIFELGSKEARKSDLSF